MNLSLKLFLRQPIAVGLFIAIRLLGSDLLAQDDLYKPDIGYTELLAERGAALEQGAGIVVAHIAPPELPPALPPEIAEYEPTTARYLPLITHSFFDASPGPVKVFVNGSLNPNAADPEESNGHASSVGWLFYGDRWSIAPQISDITGFDSNDYINRLLGFSIGSDPLFPGASLPFGGTLKAFDVTNHSYVVLPGGNDPLTPTDKINLLRRFDFVINRDNTVAVVGTNNGALNSDGSNKLIPDLWAPSFNAITVGLSNGLHPHTLTTDYPAQPGGAGRVKPDIVVPRDFVSAAVPVVAAGAALLKDAAGASNAGKNEVIKSLLFAGATKNEIEFSSWNRTTLRPIDEKFGFGELNILNSYRILQGGEVAASENGLPSVKRQNGWSHGNYDGSANRLLSYDFEIMAGTTVTELSAALVWNLNVTDSNPSTAVFNPSTSLSNLDLRLYRIGVPGFVDESLSIDYNLEHLYVTNLLPGNYRFQISGGPAGLGGSIATDYGFAFRMSTVPDPVGDLGDANGDGNFDFGDIEAFFLALSDLSAYMAQYPDVSIRLLDINGDGNTDFGDIEAFFIALTSVIE